MDRSSKSSSQMATQRIRSSPPAIVERPISYQSKDDEYLRRTGKQPVLKRNFGFISILSFSLLALNTWGGSFLLLGVGLENGGPAGLIYSFILVWMGNLATFTTLAELASIAPTAGGQYHWVAILAPNSCQKALSYVTGWLTVCGWEASCAASSYVGGILIQGLIQVVHPAYEAKLWHATLLTYAVVLVSVGSTLFVGHHLPKLESALLVMYILGFFGILIPIVYLGPHEDVGSIFTTFNNGGGWSSQGLSFFVGISGNAFAFLGADSVYHMSEEIRNSPVTVPKAMVLSMIINGVVGLSMFIAILASAADLEAALASDYVYPFIAVILQAINSRAGTAVIMVLLLIQQIGLTIGVVAASSRMLWSFSRDRGVPGWSYISKIQTRAAMPVVAIAVTTTVTILLNLISLGSSVAFNDVISLTVSALYASYLVACVLFLVRRVQRNIRPHAEAPLAEEYDLATGTPNPVNAPGRAGRLFWGPWRVPEPLGTAVNVFAIVYLAIVFIFSFFPPATPVSPSTMNYSILVSGFVAIASGVYYVAVAKKKYVGPVVETEIGEFHTLEK